MASSSKETTINKLRDLDHRKMLKSFYKVIKDIEVDTEAFRNSIAIMLEAFSSIEKKEFVDIINEIEDGN